MTYGCSCTTKKGLQIQEVISNKTKKTRPQTIDIAAMLRKRAVSTLRLLRPNSEPKFFGSELRWSVVVSDSYNCNWRCALLSQAPAGRCTTVGTTVTAAMQAKQHSGTEFAGQGLCRGWNVCARVCEWGHIIILRITSRMFTGSTSCICSRIARKPLCSTCQTRI